MIRIMSLVRRSAPATARRWGPGETKLASQAPASPLRYRTQAVTVLVWRLARALRITRYCMARSMHLGTVRVPVQ